MSNQSLNKINIGWDIGGAHIKYCVESDLDDIIWYDVIDFEFWKEYKNLNNLVKRINTLHSRSNYTIKNYFTMSAEMCDCFENRDIGIKHILNEIIRSKCNSYIFTKHGFVRPVNIKKNYFKDIGSYNWYASALYISPFYKNAIVIDFGSTSCDFLIIKNHKIYNKRISDLSGLQNKELLYTGCARTPIFSNLHKIKFNNQSYTIIPEQFSSMSDIYVILDKLNIRDIYSKSSNGLSHSKLNSYKRLSRSFGFDYSPSKMRLLRGLSQKIYKDQKNLIHNTITYHLKKYFKNVDTVNIIALGLGHHTIIEICKKYQYQHVDMNSFLNNDIVNGEYLFHLFPAFVLNRLIK